VIQLDITPTVLAATGSAANDAVFDGVNLLPFLEGSDRGSPHDTLFWRFGEQMAIRRGEWKLVRWGTNETTLPGERWPKLYRISSDIGESQDLAAEEPAQVAELDAAWQAWNRELPPPRGKSGEQTPRREKNGKNRKRSSA
jgi:arylsulfatase A-like enzyme